MLSLIKYICKKKQDFLYKIWKIAIYNKPQ